MQVSYTKVGLSTFMVTGCPNSMQSQCEHYNVHQFASFCYIPMKIVSQLLHLHNIYNATKELLTVRSLHDIFQINKLVR